MVVLNEATFACITNRLYAGIEEEAAWIEALSDLGKLLFADVITHHIYDHRKQQGRLMPIVGLEAEEAIAYQEHYGKLNVWVIHGKHMIHPGEVTASHLMYPNEKLLHTEFYNDWLRPIGAFAVMSAVLSVDDGMAHSLSFCRGRPPGDFNAEEQAFLRRFVPHLDRACRLRRRLAAAGGGLFDKAVLDRMPTGVVLVDERGSVVCLNTAATAILGQHDGLALDCDHMTATQGSARKSLAAAITAAVSPATTPLPGGFTLRVPRPSLAAPYEIWIAPLRGQGGRDKVRAVVFIADPDRQPVVAEETLFALYKLTHAEARVAAALLRGAGVEKVASALGISEATVRTHLKSIMRKTGVARQSELVKRILVGVGPLVPAPPSPTRS